MNTEETLKDAIPEDRRHFYRFGPFRLYVTERELFREGEPVALTPKALDTLLALVSQHGHVVDKDELMKTLWPDTFVEEDSLVRQISHLRKVLGDGPDGEPYIETVPRRGYRFSTPVTESWEEEPTEPRLAAAGPGGREAGCGGRRRLAWLVGAACLLAAGVTGWFLFLRSGRGAPEAVLRAIPLTSYPGEETFPCFSPDGSQIAFAWKREGGDSHDIYVKVVGPGEPLKLTSGPRDHTAPAWSPDGREIAFCRESKDGAGIYAVSPLGGSERLLAQLGAGPPEPSLGYAPAQLSWSPDGELLAFPDQNSPGEPYIVWGLSRATGAKRKLTSPPAGWLGDGSPAFSPDGQTLAFVRVRVVGHEDIFLMPAGGGEPRRLTFDERHLHGIAWTADGREILFSSSRTRESHLLWRVSKSGGNPRLVAGLGGGYLPAIPRHGRRLVFAREAWDTNIWRVEAPDPDGTPKPATRLIASTRSDENPVFSPDGKRIAFISDRAGSFRGWVCDSDGSNPVQLPIGGQPVWSPDGREIAVESNRGGNLDIYVIGSQAAIPRRLTNDRALDTKPTWSGDGRWVYFGSNRTGAWQVWKVPAEGGTLVQVTKHGGYAALESPDGKFVYYTKDRVVEDAWKVPVGGGEEVPVLENLPSRWCVTEKGLYFLGPEEGTAPDGGRWFVQFFDFATKRVTPVAALAKKPYLPIAPAVSPDGRTFLYTQVDSDESDLMLVEYFSVAPK